MDCPNSTIDAAQDARPKCATPEQTQSLFPDLFGDRVAADKTRPKSKSILDRVPDANLQKSIDAFSKQHKIDVTQSNGWLTYSMDAHGKSGVLFKTDASEYGLREAEIRLSTLVTARQKQIEQRYAVKFAVPGDIVDYQRQTDEAEARPRLIHAVQPELYQLEGLMSGLEKSGPTSFAVGAQDMKIYFLADKVVLDKPGHASYQNDRGGTPSIYFFPSINEVSKPTDADLSAVDRKKSYADKTRPETIESIAMHQMGHHQFFKMGYQNSVEGEVFQSQMGWVRNRDWSTIRTPWLILGKDTDSDGTNASYFPNIDATTGTTTWVRTKPDGGGVDSRGRRVPIVQAERLTSEQMRDKALMKPPTLNFNSPEDEYAESIRMHRLAETSRRDLIRSSPFIYDQVKTNDQKEIDDKYGKQSDGTSKYLRAAGGQLVPNDDLNRLQIQSFEILSMYPDLRMKIDGVAPKKPGK